MEWIRIVKGDKSTLPEPEQRVLVFIKQPYGILIEIAELTEEGKWYIPFKHLLGVTHWQPLPDHPKKQH